MIIIILSLSLLLVLLVIRYYSMQQVSVPIEGCDSPKQKSLCELVEDYNSRTSHLANYRWFLPPAGELAVTLPYASTMRNSVTGPLGRKYLPRRMPAYATVCERA